jgi:hypothetical protein
MTPRPSPRAGGGGTTMSDRPTGATATDDVVERVRRRAAFPGSLTTRLRPLRLARIVRDPSTSLRAEDGGGATSRGWG